jgi:hypothetical protein
MPTLLIGDPTGPITYGTTYLRRHPVVGWASLVFGWGADVRQVFDARDVVWIRTTIETTGELDGIQRFEDVLGDGKGLEVMLFCLRPVAPNDAIRLHHFGGRSDPGEELVIFR